jgi:hypothetical protein
MLRLLHDTTHDTDFENIRRVCVPWTLDDAEQDDFVDQKWNAFSGIRQYCEDRAKERKELPAALLAAVPCFSGDVVTVVVLYCLGPSFPLPPEEWQLKQAVNTAFLHTLGLIVPWDKGPYYNTQKKATERNTKRFRVENTCFFPNYVRKWYFGEAPFSIDELNAYFDVRHLNCAGLRCTCLNQPL